MSILTIERSGVIAPGVVAPQIGNTEYESAFGKITNFIQGKTSLNYTFLTNLSSVAKVTQTWTSERHAQSFNIANIKLPRYIIEANYFYNKIAQEVFEGNVQGVSYKDMQDNLCIQAIAQKVRIGALYGFASGEGILANTSSFTFGNDPQSNSTAQTYDPAWFRNKILHMVRTLLGEVRGMTDRVVLLTSRRMAYLIGSTVVPLTDSQKAGAGIDTIGGSLSRIVEEGLKIKCEVILDDTLENANAGGDKDLFVAIAPGFSQDAQVNSATGQINAVGLNAGSIAYNTTMDKGIGRTTEEINPSQNRTMSGLHYIYITPGYTLRSEAVLKAEIQY